MNTALVSPSLPTIVLYAASFVLVIWTVTDVARRPSSELPTGRKAAWIIGSVVGWLLFGIVGAVVAILYLMGPRRRMNTQRW
jgi:cytochrome c oxidase assembly factor CtaG